LPLATGMRSFATLQRGGYPARDDSIAGARATPPGDVTALLASRPGDPPSLVFRRVRRPLSGTKVFAGASLRLTELSNVVAYVCRSLQRKNRHHVHSLPVPSSRPHRSRWISRYTRCKTVLVELHAIRAGSPGFLGGGSSPPPGKHPFQSRRVPRSVARSRAAAWAHLPPSTSPERHWSGALPARKP